MASNYPPGVTDADIDNHFGPDEPEAEEVIVPSDILDRLIEENADEMDGAGLYALEGARNYLIRENRFDDPGFAGIALAKFLGGLR